MFRKVPVVISTSLEKYQDVVVTKVSTDRSASTGDSLRFQVEFQEIKFVTLAEIVVESATRPLDVKTSANRQATKKSTKGKVGGKEKILDASKFAVVRTP